MKLTLSVSYGVGVLLRIHEQAGDGPVTAARIARGCRFPPRFLYRVLRRLVDAGVLLGTSGPGGGYSLARKPQQVTLLDIVRGVESGPEPSVLVPVCTAQRGAIERVNAMCEHNAEQFSDELANVTLADLVRKEPAARVATRVAKRTRARVRPK